MTSLFVLHTKNKICSNKRYCYEFGYGAMLFLTFRWMTRCTGVQDSYDIAVCLTRVATDA